MGKLLKLAALLALVPAFLYAGGETGAVAPPAPKAPTHIPMYIRAANGTDYTETDTEYSIHTHGSRKDAGADNSH